jgi:hypothetical protein
MSMRPRVEDDAVTGRTRRIADSSGTGSEPVSTVDAIVRAGLGQMVLPG